MVLHREPRVTASALRGAGRGMMARISGRSPWRPTCAGRRGGGDGAPQLSGTMRTGGDGPGHWPLITRRGRTIGCSPACTATCTGRTTLPQGLAARGERAVPLLVGGRRGGGGRHQRCAVSLVDLRSMTLAWASGLTPQPQAALADSMRASWRSRTNATRLAGGADEVAQLSSTPTVHHGCSSTGKRPLE